MLLNYHVSSWNNYPLCGEDYVELAVVCIHGTAGMLLFAADELNFLVVSNEEWPRAQLNKRGGAIL